MKGFSVSYTKSSQYWTECLDFRDHASKGRNELEESSPDAYLGLPDSVNSGATLTHGSWRLWDKHVLTYGETIRRMIACWEMLLVV